MADQSTDLSEAERIQQRGDELAQSDANLLNLNDAQLEQMGDAMQQGNIMAVLQMLFELFTGEEGGLESLFNFGQDQEVAEAEQSQSTPDQDTSAQEADSTPEQEDSAPSSAQEEEAPSSEQETASADLGGADGTAYTAVVPSQEGQFSSIEGTSDIFEQNLNGRFGAAANAENFDIVNATVDPNQSAPEQQQPDLSQEAQNNSMFTMTV